MRMVTKKDILEALGMETEDRFMTGLFIGIGLGALVGGITSLLLAPSRGSDLREQIGDKVRTYVGKVRTNDVGKPMEGDILPRGTTREPGTY